jgi:hypothetical protein
MFSVDDAEHFLPFRRFQANDTLLAFLESF